MRSLLARARAGDRGAEEQLFEVLRARLTTIAKRRVWEKEAADDVVQQACLTVLEKYKTEEFPSGFEVWANGVLRMKIGNYLQSKKTSEDRFHFGLDTEWISTYPAAEPCPDLEARLIDCLKKMVRVNPRYARVLSLSYQGYRSDEICGRMHVTRSNLHSILSRGRAALSKCLETGRL
jgi:RNA polymerase sigma factor (sigma-70 family)